MNEPPFAGASSVTRPPFRATAAPPASAVTVVMTRPASAERSSLGPRNVGSIVSPSRNAYLSACRTADAGPRLADEAIHLTGAFQLAGYRHVIGTLWPVYDLISAIVAENVYRRLTRDGTTPPDTNTTASALRAAIRDLRETHPSRPDLWAGYVHVGP